MSFGDIVKDFIGFDTRTLDPDDTDPIYDYCDGIYDVTAIVIATDQGDWDRSVDPWVWVPEPHYHTKVEVTKSCKCSPAAVEPRDTKCNISEAEMPIAPGLQTSGWRREDKIYYHCRSVKEECSPPLKCGDPEECPCPAEPSPNKLIKENTFKDRPTWSGGPVLTAHAQVNSFISKTLAEAEKAMDGNCKKAAK